MKEALARFRFWLLAWYFAVSALALLGFGGAAYWVFEKRLLRQTDHLLLEHLHGGGTAGDGIQVYRFDEEGLSEDGTSAPEWLQPYVTEVFQAGVIQATLRVDEDRETEGGEAEVEHFWRIVGRALPSTPRGAGNETRRAELAVTDLQTFTERTADLLTALALAGAAALLVVGAGGYILSRRAMAPAEVAFEEMRRFTGDAAHELRTPLQIIRGQVDVALQQPRDARTYRQALEAVGLEAQRLSHVVDGLLTLARAEAGTAGISRQPALVSDLIFDTLPSAQRLAAGADITVDVEVEGEPEVMGDPVLLRQALLILVDNAARYSPRGSRVLLRGTVEGKDVCLEVEDQGPGIPLEARERFLERFQGERAKGRTGLGLAILRWIADAHGGKVAILDAPGGGALVRIALPALLSSS